LPIANLKPEGSTSRTNRQSAIGNRQSEVNLSSEEDLRMGVPLPNLDDRRWIDLVEEGRSLLPFYAPQWTDHNIHDPGITLLELFSDRRRRSNQDQADRGVKRALPQKSFISFTPGFSPVLSVAGKVNRFNGLGPPRIRRSKPLKRLADLSPLAPG
jgi:hypothetical protein